MKNQINEMFEKKSFLTALAPMQDVTTKAFMSIIASYSAPDLFVTEFFRVHGNSKLEAHIVDSIQDNQTNRPIMAQIIGESLPDLTRAIKDLHELNIAGVDLNMGCPAPKVYKKNVGGGLLRDPSESERVIAHFRENIQGVFSVKLRIGFEDDRYFDKIIDLLRQYEVDFVTLHARTVKGGYRTDPSYEYISRAVNTLDCPVFANGDVTSAYKAKDVIELTGARGVMVGRSAIRNPWIFRQIDDLINERAIYRPTLGNVREYVQALVDMTTNTHAGSKNEIGILKKFINFIGIAIDPKGGFLKKMRRSQNVDELLAICDVYLIELGNSERLFPLESYNGLLARPNREKKLS